MSKPYLSQPENTEGMSRRITPWEHWIDAERFLLNKDNWLEDYLKAQNDFQASIEQILAAGTAYCGLPAAICIGDERLKIEGDSIALANPPRPSVDDALDKAWDPIETSGNRSIDTTGTVSKLRWVCGPFSKTCDRQLSTSAKGLCVELQACPQFESKSQRMFLKSDNFSHELKPHQILNRNAYLSVSDPERSIQYELLNDSASLKHETLPGLKAAEVHVFKCTLQDLGLLQQSRELSPLETYRILIPPGKKYTSDHWPAASFYNLQHGWSALELTPAELTSPEAPLQLATLGLQIKQAVLTCEWLQGTPLHYRTHTTGESYPVFHINDELILNIRGESLAGQTLRLIRFDGQQKNTLLCIRAENSQNVTLSELTSGRQMLAIETEQGFTILEFEITDNYVAPETALMHLSTDTEYVEAYQRQRHEKVTWPGTQHTTFTLPVHWPYTVRYLDVATGNQGGVASHAPAEALPLSELPGYADYRQRCQHMVITLNAGELGQAIIEVHPDRRNVQPFYQRLKANYLDVMQTLYAKSYYHQSLGKLINPLFAYRGLSMRSYPDLDRLDISWDPAELFEIWSAEFDPRHNQPFRQRVGWCCFLHFDLAQSTMPPELAPELRAYYMRFAPMIYTNGLYWSREHGYPELPLKWVPLHQHLSSPEAFVLNFESALFQGFQRRLQ